MSFVQHRFKLAESTVDTLQDMAPEFGYDGFGEFVFYLSYSRVKQDGSKESWNDVVIRVTEGTFSIRKDWYIRNHIPWDEDFWQHYALHFATSMFKMEWLPAGRGLWACGTEMIYERGSMALYNCAAIKISSSQMGEEFSWIMDSLMHGVGVGFHPERDDELQVFNHQDTEIFVIPDSREGWSESIQRQIDSYLTPNNPKLIFDYSLLRPAGAMIKTFGGTASGPEPLKELHDRIETFFHLYQTEDWYDSVLLKLDIGNSIGCAVVAGGSRRSAQLACGPIDDLIFADLKDREAYPHRAAFQWMSNNSVTLEKDEDFEKLSVIADRVKTGTDLGFINLRNLTKGRIGKNDGLRQDTCELTNPCGEIGLDPHGETCNIAESLPTRCENSDQWLKACEYATVYMSTVSLLPTHQPRTNSIVARNRRIGLSIIDFTGWVKRDGYNKVTKYLRQGYQIVIKTNEWVNGEAGIALAIRHTCLKPGGTVPKIAGRTPSLSYPTFIHTLRRVRVGKKNPLHKLLEDANIPFETDVVDPYTDVFEFPILQGPAKPASEASLHEQAMNLVMLQREWADNAVSNTLYFKPKWTLTKVINYFSYLEEIWYGFNVEGLWENSATEAYNHNKTQHLKIDYTTGNISLYTYNEHHEEDDIEPVLAMIAPLVKSVSLLPHTAEGVYPQMPESGISEEEYKKRKASIKKIDWSQLKNIEPEGEKYCQGDRCDIKPAAAL